MHKKIKLIAIPYAGGSKYSYKQLKPFFNSNVELVTIELPGRGNRVAEPLLNRIDLMVIDLYEQIKPFLNESYILYGHSMGGTLGNQLIHKIIEEKNNLPIFFLVTGACAPQFKKYEVIMHKLEPLQLKEELKKLGGLPNPILENEELMDFFLPIIRADLEAIETWEYKNFEKHSVPIVAIAGDKERIDDQQLQGWSLETKSEFTGIRTNGNHFFIFNNFMETADLIHRKIDAFHNAILNS